MSPPTPRPVFYTYAQLAELWHVHPVTIRKWVCADKKAGFHAVVAYRFDRHQRRRHALIREDLAIALFARHMGAGLLAP